MATLVLTAVGTALGGPVGGALGALLGRSVDARVFRPAAREGPRLTELAVQTSSYGTQIPRLYGTMRVAGTVIWATDLIETRSTAKGGKGQPSTASYSYSASFAVLLSARAIVGVRRIWAEGKLVRGAGGDWKTRTAFRLHTGGEDQAADPLIASAEGSCPAYRGCAYAVLEGLQLADFGNRIPSLTFEVVADAGAVPVGAIAHDLADAVSGDAALSLDGFAASGGSVAAVLETLATMSGGWWSPGGSGVILRDAAPDVVPITDADIAVRGSDARSMRAVASAETAPRAVSVSHYDPARDYQTGVQRARRPGPGAREERIEAPAAIDAGTAKRIAEGMLARGDDGRITRTVVAGIEGMALIPGGCVAIVGEPGIWRITRVAIEALATVLTLTPVTRAPQRRAATSGRVLPAPDLIIGRTILHAFEIPALGDSILTVPRIGVVATGEAGGWRRAALLYSLDDGGSWIEAGTSAEPGIIGTLTTPLAPAPATLVDRAHEAMVTLARADMVLADADETALDRGANLALVGDELLQFASAVPMGDGAWRLSGLLRGRRGTGAMTGMQRVGDRFVLIEADSVATIDVPVSAIGRAMRVMASGVGDIAEPAIAAVPVTGASVVPPAPAHLAATPGTDGSIVLSWIRRSRLGWRWNDGVDAPLGEEREAYAVDIVAADGSVRSLATTEPHLAIAANTQTRTVTVRQQGTIGVSAPATLVIRGEGS